MSKSGMLNHGLPVKKVMQKDVITVKFDTPVMEVISKMKANKISGLIVVDSIGETIGVVSGLDIFKVVKERDGVEDIYAENIMTPFTISVYPEDTLSTAALTMIENNIHRLVVTESPTRKKPIGIITSTDLINNIL
jgi:CBS domain-containing protein